MPVRDPPVWARGVAAAFLLVASWWLLNTNSIRGLVGESIGALCIGVIAASILQGMHLPLAIWSEGPWRKRFAAPAVIGTAIGLAALILIARIANIDTMVDQLDLGTGILCVIGAVGLGFGVGFVRQRTYLAWYGFALALGIVPFLSDLVVTSFNTADRTVPLCLLSAPSSENGCTIAVLPSAIFLTAVGVASKLVTEELAFRRLLIGAAARAGISSILFSSLVALAWYLVLSRSGVGTTGSVVAGAVGALSAGCIYVLSKSLVASAIFSAAFAASNISAAAANAPVGTPAEGWVVSLTYLVAASVVSLLLCSVVFRKHGFLGNLKEATSRHVISN